MWGNKMKHVHSDRGTAVLLWSDFVHFMERSFASSQPERDARRCYAKLRQTGTVKDYVREQSQLVRELEGTSFHPRGSVFDFIEGLQADVQSFVDDHAPIGW